MDTTNYLNEPDKNRKYLIYCRSGRRTGDASDIMEELEFREVYDITDGITKWQEEEFQDVK